MFLDKKSLNLAKQVIFIVLLIFVFFQVSPQTTVLAQEVEIDYGRGPVELALVSASTNVLGETQEQKIISALPYVEELPYYTTYITATAYTSRPEETDDDPYIAAWGDHVFWGMLASNAFRKNTKIQIPEYFGSKMFTVLDTMNKRYYHRIDIWMPDLDEAKAWGTRYVEIRIFK